MRGPRSGRRRPVGRRGPQRAPIRGQAAPGAEGGRPQGRPNRADGKAKDPASRRGAGAGGGRRAGGATTASRRQAEAEPPPPARTTPRHDRGGTRDAPGARQRPGRAQGPKAPGAGPGAAGPQKTKTNKTPFLFKTCIEQQKRFCLTLSEDGPCLEGTAEAGAVGHLAADRERTTAGRSDRLAACAPGLFACNYYFARARVSLGTMLKPLQLLS